MKLFKITLKYISYSDEFFVFAEKDSEAVADILNNYNTYDDGSEKRFDTIKLEVICAEKEIRRIKELKQK